MVVCLINETCKSDMHYQRNKEYVWSGREWKKMDNWAKMEARICPDYPSSTVHCMLTLFMRPAMAARICTSNEFGALAPLSMSLQGWHTWEKQREKENDMWKRKTFLPLAQAGALINLDLSGES